MGCARRRGTQPARDALGAWLEGWNHDIGWIAIPGIAAKPVIDMLAGVRDLGDARAAFDLPYELGYFSTPRRQDEAHHFLEAVVQPVGGAYGLHLTEPGSDLAGAPRLHGCPSCRSRAGRRMRALKAHLAERHRSDLAAYTTGKRGFVARVLARRRARFPFTVSV